MEKSGVLREEFPFFCAARLDPSSKEEGISIQQN